jgi:hypothetical protein
LDPDEFCNLKWATMGSIANKRSNDELIKLQEIVNLFSMFAMIMMFQFFRKSQREMEYHCDKPNQC